MIEISELVKSDSDDVRQVYSNFEITFFPFFFFFFCNFDLKLHVTIVRY